MTSGHENASAHAMVKVKYEDESPARWQCFTHGPECWTTAALRKTDPTTETTMGNPTMKRMTVSLVVPELFEAPTLAAVYNALTEIGDRPDCGFNFWSIKTENQIIDFDDELPDKSFRDDYPSTPVRSAEDLEAAKELIAEGRIFCESNIMDAHKATRVGPDGGFYCDEHEFGD